MVQSARRAVSVMLPLAFFTSGMFSAGIFGPGIMLKPVLLAAKKGLNQPHMDLGAVCVLSAGKFGRAAHWLTAAEGAWKASEQGCQKTIPAGSGVNVVLQQKA